jgi:hypothetical protein
MDRATKALVDYGFTQKADGSLYRGRKGEKYVPVEGGFEHYFRGEKMSFSIKSDWAGVGGLYPTTHPECFEFTFPPEWIINEYETAVANKAQWAAEAAARKAG